MHGLLRDTAQEVHGLAQSVHFDRPWPARCCDQQDNEPESQETMDITIIGTGNMARGIATRALAGGNTVTLLGTDEDKARALAGDLPGEVRTGTVGDPISGDVV